MCTIILLRMKKNDRVLLGMSGGVDSSMAALLLREKGFEVIGITFVFTRSTQYNHHFVKDAQILARQLGIKHIIKDLRQEFEKEVISYFIHEYVSARTPFPCAYCNPNIKFKYLKKIADIENCYYIATGHYVQNDLYEEKKYIFQGVDPDKDQTFFLWGLQREIVDRLIFPLGKFLKTEIRELARQNGFIDLSQKKDSLGICFIEGNDYRKFLNERGIQSRKGNFVDHNNLVLGRHNGITNYTIGQRRGLGLNLNHPVFVSEIRLERNEIVLSKFDDLYRNKLYLKNYNFIDNEIVKEGKQLIVKVRYRLQKTLCSLNILDESRAEVDLLNSEAMISPGQTAVFYDGTRLVGGGFIESAS